MMQGSTDELSVDTGCLTPKTPPNHPIISHPIAPRFMGAGPLHRPPREGVIDNHAGDAAGLHVSDILPAGGLVGATA